MRFIEIFIRYVWLLLIFFLGALPALLAGFIVVSLLTIFGIKEACVHSALERLLIPQNYVANEIEKIQDDLTPVGWFMLIAFTWFIVIILFIAFI